jgi:methionyl-tRNA synthetase
MLLAAGYEPPHELFVHGFLLLGDQKISKSLGNVVDPLDLVDLYGADALRFWCARATTFGHDGNVSVDGIRDRYERELGNDLGNLLSRTTAMLARYRDGVIRPAASDDSPVKALLDPLAADVAARFDVYDITGALERIWEVVRGLNRHVEATAPWQLARDETRAADLDSVLYDLADGLRAVAVALASYLPGTSPNVLAALHQPPDLDWAGVAYGVTDETTGIEPAPPLFPRIDTPQAAA